VLVVLFAQNFLESHGKTFDTISIFLAVLLINLFFAPRYGVERSLVIIIAVVIVAYLSGFYSERDALSLPIGKYKYVLFIAVFIIAPIVRYILINW
jgi:hypothetical protein